MVSELGGSQISTLLETLPGIANVLRSPVADALGSVIRAAARVDDFNVADGAGCWGMMRATGFWLKCMRPSRSAWTKPPIGRRP